MFPPSPHAKVSMSKLPRILECPGSLIWAGQFDSTQHPAAKEGEMLHFAIERCIRKERTNCPNTIVQPEYDIVLTAEQTSAVDDALDYFWNLYRSLDINTFHIEKQGDLRQYHPILYETGGTADIVLTTTGGEVYVIDWKFGRGIPVYAGNNDQIRGYAACAVESWAGLNLYNTFHLYIIQPRLDIYDSETLSSRDMAGWLKGRVIPGIEQAYSNEAEFRPGDMQCRFCPGKTRCRVRIAHASRTASEIFTTHLGLANTVDIEELVELHHQWPRVQQCFKDIQTYLFSLALQGQSIPGLKLVEGKSNRRWKDEKQAIEFLMTVIDPAEIFEQKLISAPKAEKLGRLKKDPRFLELVEKPPGSPSLVPETDKRPAIDILSAAERFAQFAEEYDDE